MFMYKCNTKKNHNVDVAIVGGGVIGSSIAYFLSKTTKERKMAKNIVVIEKDPTFKSGATTRSAGSIRHQFTNPTNIQMCQFGTHFIRNIHEYLSVDNQELPEVTFHEKGYLFLASPEGEKILRNNHKVQTGLGANIKLLNPEEILERFPWMNTSGVSLGSLGISGEGWLDPYSLLVAFKRKAQSLGVQFIKDEVIGTKVNSTKNFITGMTLKSGENLNFNESTVVVNAAGGCASDLMKMVGDDIPVRPRKRCIFVLDCPDKRIKTAPLVIDISGVYFRPEGQHFIAGCSPPDEQDHDVAIDDFEIDYSLWENTVWPTIAERVPAFESVKLLSAWAGHYDYNTFDQNAILGPHSTIKNLYLANGFSGHGLQQSPAVGRALSELILDGKYVTLDLSEMSFQRIANNKPIIELNIV